LLLHLTFTTAFVTQVARQRRRLHCQERMTAELTGSQSRWTITCL